MKIGIPDKMNTDISPPRRGAGVGLIKKPIHFIGYSDGTGHLKNDY